MQVPTMAEMDEWTDTLRVELDAFQHCWDRYEREIDEIIESGDEARNELHARDGKGPAASVAGFRLARKDLFGIWNKMVKHLEGFNLEREKQTARVISAIAEVQTLKDELNAEHAKLREEQEQMRKEQAILREYFDTLKNQNEALMQTRSAPATSESSTLNEIKDLIKSMKDD